MRIQGTEWKDNRILRDHMVTDLSDDTRRRIKRLHHYKNDDQMEHFHQSAQQKRNERLYDIHMPFQRHESADQSDAARGYNAGRRSDAAHPKSVNTADKSCDHASDRSADKAREHGPHVAYRNYGASEIKTRDVAVDAEHTAQETRYDSEAPVFLGFDVFFDDVTAAYEGRYDQDDGKSAYHP